MSGKERYWGHHADRYDEFTDYVVGRQLRHALFNRLIDEKDLGETVEFGCGTGFYTRAIAQNALNVSATDISEEMLNRAKNNLNCFVNINFQKADCENLIFSAESFDTVLLANVVHILARPENAIAESFRTLRQSGRLLIITYTNFGLEFLESMSVAMRFWASFGMPPPHGLKNYSPLELRTLTKNAGFQVETLEVIGDTVKGLFLKGKKERVA